MHVNIVSAPTLIIHTDSSHMVWCGQRAELKAKEYFLATVLETSSDTSKLVARFNYSGSEVQPFFGKQIQSQ